MSVIEIYGDVLKEKDARITALEAEIAALKRENSTARDMLGGHSRFITKLLEYIREEVGEEHMPEDLLALLEASQ